MNIYEKINQVKLNILNSNLKKSGQNKFANFDYYELGDITPTILNNCKELKLFTHITFEQDKATLTIINIENTNEKVVYTSPVVELELKGCNKIQALGGAETYLRRYLYLIAFDIVEPDLLDSVVGKNGGDKITEAQLKFIQDLSLDNQKICEHYGVDALPDLTKEQAKEIIRLKANKK